MQENEMCNYYDLSEHPGKKQDNKVLADKFAYLNDPEISSQILDFQDGKTNSVTFLVPTMHCSSCIWLLEHLYRFDQNIVQSRVNFLKKQVAVTYKTPTQLGDVASLLASIGYEPHISLDDLEKKESSKANKSLLYKVGIAAFSFGNIMLLSFPEYLSIDANDAFLQTFFSYTIILLSIPVFFYCSTEYLISAWKGLKKGIINIDVPLSLGIITLYIRSVYDIFAGAGPGYMDSFAGLVFFLLLGKLFQNKTYEYFNFERNYKSYFPISVIVKKNNVEKYVPLSKLKKGDRVVIRYDEVIPADSYLLQGNGNIDYSFVTGESTPIAKVLGEMLYAGGKQKGEAIEVEIAKEVSQSYLTQLWNDFKSDKFSESKLTTLANVAGKYFTFFVLAIAVITFLYHAPVSLETGLIAFTSVLIIACPCALALSTPFTLGNAMRLLGRKECYVKKTEVIEELAKVDTIVFDKTGTITYTDKSELEYVGDSLSEEDRIAIKNLVKNSTHPLSVTLTKITESDEKYEIIDFTERANKGIEGKIAGKLVKAGSLDFVANNMQNNELKVYSEAKHQVNSSLVYISIDNYVKGYFKVRNSYRENMSEMIKQLSEEFELHLLSGDNESERKRLEEFFPKGANLLFEQSPENKKNFIDHLQINNHKVLMLGDGLNDAGALMKSDVGIAVAENVFNFTPTSDAIMKAGILRDLPKILHFSKSGVTIIKFSFLISILYNIVGLFFAVQGMISPLFAAVLMPLSSISVVVFTTLSTLIMAKKQRIV